MMREDNLLCVRRRAFVVTTDSRHNLPVYANLAREMTPAAINQLWVADITSFDCVPSSCIWPWCWMHSLAV
jgi:putative transposase